jgi:hypothetical protein
VADRVGQQVGEHLPNPDGVDLQLGDAGSGAPAERHASTGSPGGEGRHRVLGERRRLHRLAVEAEHAGLRGGEGLQVVKEPRHHRRLLEDGAEVGLIGGIKPVEHPLDGTADHRQRRAQLVGDVGEQGAALLLVRLQARGHLVERLGQAAHLLRTPGLDAGGVVTARDPVGRLHDVADRRRHAPHQPPGQQRDHHDPEEHDRDREQRRAAAPLAGPEATGQQPEKEAGEEREQDEQREQEADAAREAPPAPAALPGRREGLALRPPGRRAAVAAPVRHPRTGTRRRGR